MSRDRNGDGLKREHDGEEQGAIVVAETVRLAGTRPALPADYLAPPPSKEDRIPLFWRLFGGTMLSILALVCLTVYNQFTTTISDLRRDILQLQDARADLIRKEEFNAQLTKLWTVFKELQTANNSLGALNERLRGMDQQFEKQIKTGDDERKDLRAKVEDLRKAHQVQGEELRKAADTDRKDHHRDLEEVRKAADATCKEIARKLEEHFKTALDERKELHRKFEEQLKVVSDERRELNLKLQTVAERLATVEGRQAAVPAEKKPPVND